MKKTAANTDGAARRLANLKPPFPKGVSGNPNGRPKGLVSIKAELKQLLTIALKNEHNPLSDEVELDMPVGRKIALNLVIAAAEGNAKAAYKLIEHMEGKPAQAINLGGQDDNPVQVTGQLEVILRRPKESPHE